MHQVLSSFPPSLVSRLHCIQSHHLLHNNPFLNKEKIIENNENPRVEGGYWKRQENSFLLGLCDSGENKSAMTMLGDTKVSPLNTGDLDGKRSELVTRSRAHILNLRADIIGCFQEMLLGDALAAEYLLMHLLSTVYEYIYEIYLYKIIM